MMAGAATAPSILPRRRTVGWLGKGKAHTLSPCGRGCRVSARRVRGLRWFGWVGFTNAGGGADHAQNALGIDQHIAVPEPNHRVAGCFEMAGTGAINLGVMLAAIDLDDQPAVEAHEVDDVTVDRLLPPEFQPEQAAVAQRAPQPALGIGAVAAQAFGSDVRGTHSCVKFRVDQVEACRRSSLLVKRPHRKPAIQVRDFLYWRARPGDRNSDNAVCFGPPHPAASRPPSPARGEGNEVIAPCGPLPLCGSGRCSPVRSRR